MYRSVFVPVIANGDIDIGDRFRIQFVIMTSLIYHFSRFGFCWCIMIRGLEKTACSSFNELLSSKIVNVKIPTH